MSDLTYPEVGATAGDLPDGYHHVRASRMIGQGRAAFDTASTLLLSWQMHQRAGVRKIFGPDAVVQGRDVAFRWLLLRFECRVVAVIDEPAVEGGPAYCFLDDGLVQRLIVDVRLWFDPTNVTSGWSPSPI